MRTVVTGKRSGVVRCLANAARDCVNTVIENMKPGTPALEVAAKGKEELASLPGHIV